DAYRPGDLFDIDWGAFEDDDEIVITHRVVINEPPRFSSREAAALLAGLQYLSALPSAGGHEVLDSVMTKLSRSASAEPSQLAVQSAGDADRILATVAAAVDAGLSVEFDYRTARGTSERRVVDPLRVDSVDSDWYLRAWDRRREAVRTFRVDRMSAVTQGSQAISTRPGDVAVPDALFSPSDQDTCVTVLVDVQILPFLGEYVDSVPDEVPAAGRVEIGLRLAHPDVVSRIAARFAGLMEVVDPVELRDEVRSWAQSALDAYETVPPSSDRAD
ncbi:helix-turn-helix transcriptional regulator, partial [Mycetocola reblochoni]|uniref:helix-turn-helix transcriptional regulator n=1 Tax=Mycetocola reblochoni TaxID=331618 RepID=UPI003F998161